MAGIKRVIGLGPSSKLFPKPKVWRRAPTSADNQYKAGQVVIDEVLFDAWFLCGYSAGIPQWINAGGGTGTFASLTVTGAATIGTTLTVSSLGLGAVLSSATGVLSNVLGTDGQLLMGSTAVAPSWGSITSDGSLTITPGAGTLQLAVAGATTSSYVTDTAGPVAPLAGALTLTNTDGNLVTDGSVANTVSFDLASSISVTSKITAGDSLQMTSGTLTINANDDVAGAIALTANGGSSEKVTLTALQGTGVDSVGLVSTLGGVTITGGVASADAINISTSNAAGGIDVDAGTAGYIVDTTGAVSLDSAAASNFTVTGAFDLTLNTTLGSTIIDGGEAAGDAVQITASDAAGGIVNTCGTGGFDITSTNGTVNITSGTAAINIGADAVQHAVTIGNITGNTSIAVNWGTGGATLAGEASGVVIIGAAAQTGAMTFGRSTAANTLNIGTGINTGAQIVNVSTGASASASTVNVLSGIATAGTQTFNMFTGASTSTGMAVNVMNGAGSGTRVFTLAGSGALASTIGIGDGLLGNTITIGNGINSVAQTVSIANGASAQNSTVNILSGIGTVGVGTIAIANNTRVTTAGLCNIAPAANRTTTVSGGTVIVASVTDTLSLGGGGATTNADSIKNVNIATGNVDIGASTTNIATGTLTTSGTYDVNIATGTGVAGGVKLVSVGNADGLTDMAFFSPRESSAGLAHTLNAYKGRITATGVVTAAAADQTLTITNSICTTASGITLGVCVVGAEDAQMTIQKVRPGAGSFTVLLTNNGGAQLASNLIITFEIFN